MSTAADRRLLEARARTLAQPLPEPPTASGTARLSFTAGATRFSVEAVRVAEVVALPDLTPVPGAPPAHLGVVAHRGRLTSVVDPAALTGGRGPARSGDGLLIALEAGAAALGLRADALVDDDALSTFLDVDALVQDPRVVVDHDPDQGSLP